MQRVRFAEEAQPLQRPRQPHTNSEDETVKFIAKGAIALIAAVIIHGETKSYTYAVLTFIVVFLLMNNLNRISIVIRPIFSSGYRTFRSYSWYRAPNYRRQGYANPVHEERRRGSYRQTAQTSRFARGAAPPADLPIYTNGVRAGEEQREVPLGRPGQPTSTYVEEGAPPPARSRTSSGQRPGQPPLGSGFNPPSASMRTSTWGAGAPSATDSFFSSGQRVGQSSFVGGALNFVSQLPSTSSFGSGAPPLTDYVTGGQRPF